MLSLLSILCVMALLLGLSFGLPAYRALSTLSGGYRELRAFNTSIRANRAREISCSSSYCDSEGIYHV